MHHEKADQRVERFDSDQRMRQASPYRGHDIAYGSKEALDLLRVELQPVQKAEFSAAEAAG